MNVVAIGGGTGLSSLLRGIKNLVPDKISDLSAIVTVSDNGGSSGRLREELGIPAPGDIRNCISALAEDEDILTQVFQYRFKKGEGLKGHSFGNLFLTVLTDITGSFLEAIETTSDILKIKGKIIPSTEEEVDLIAKFTDGKVIKGETQITEYGKKLVAKIEKIWLEPENPKAPDEAIEKIQNADLIILGPGSLFTSVIPNLLIPEIKEAVLSSKAKKLYISNVMTQFGETDNFKVSDHINAIHNAVGTVFIDMVIANIKMPSLETMEKYKKENAEPVILDEEEINKIGITIFAEHLLEEGKFARHNPYKLTRLIENIIDMLKKEVHV